jgi:hypothetical protein
MKTTFRLFIFLLLCLLSWQSIHARDAMQKPNWDRALAVESASSVDAGPVLKNLYRLARSSKNRQLLDSLSAVEQNRNWSVPAREYVIWTFTIGLSDMEVNTVNREVLEYLSAYEPRTLVSHDDRGDVGVALFNIKAAAAGVQNSWRRQVAANRAEFLLQSDSTRWIDAYLDADKVERRGFIGALGFASEVQLSALARSALERLSADPALTVIAGKSALILADPELLQQTIVQGQGPDLHPILKAASLTLDAEDNRKLLYHVIRSGPEKNAGLAIAQLAPGLLGDPDVREKMFNMLENLELGTSAALVLGSSSNPEVRSRLEILAGGKDGRASQRASIAISSSYRQMEDTR